MDLTDINTIRALLAKNGFRFSKSLGQNFLRDAAIPPRIAEAAGLSPKTGVLEIGPGVGCLTAELARRAARVVAVEADTALRPVLKETLQEFGNVEILYADVLKLDLRTLAEEHFRDCAETVVCANLPYQITGPLLAALVRAGCFSRVTVMVQREVARRICAKENTPEYGAFSILMQWHMRAEILFDVPPEAFVPAPKVTSSVVRMERRVSPPAAVSDEKRMFALIRAAFNQRRKTLCNAMMHSLGLGREEAEAALAAAELDKRVRGEALSIAEFAALSDALG